jgi:hypothetical protein
MAGSRRADAEYFAHMSTQFFDKLKATQLCKDRFLIYIQSMFKQQTCAYDRANAEERRVNSQLFKEMTATFMTDLKISLREETSLHDEAHASLEMQLDFIRSSRSTKLKPWKSTSSYELSKTELWRPTRALLSFSPEDLCQTTKTSKLIPQ